MMNAAPAAWCFAFLLLSGPSVVCGVALYTFGKNTDGQLGVGNTTDLHTPQHVPAADPWGSAAITAVATGYHHTLVVQAELLFSFGANEYGQLGLNDDVTYMRPQRIMNAWGFQVITHIATGYYHSIFVVAGTSVYTFGRNSNGQLGLGTTASQNSPQLVTFDWAGAIRAVGAGYAHSVIAAGPVLYGFGSNGQGQLGLGSAQDVVTPRAGANTPWATAPVTAVRCGHSHSLLVAGGRAYAMGANGNGQLGLGHYTTSRAPQLVSGPCSTGTVTGVAAGAHHSLVLAGGHLYGFGTNVNGELGLDSTMPTDYNTPQLVPFFGNLAVTAVATGANHTVVLVGGDVYTFGSNANGQLGLGSTVSHRTAVQLTGPSAPWPPNTPSIVAAAESHTMVVAEIACITTGWGDWSACSVSCGGGEHYRFRSFTNNGNPSCFSTADIRPCNTDNCGVTSTQSYNPSPGSFGPTPAPSAYPNQSPSVAACAASEELLVDNNELDSSFLCDTEETAAALQAYECVPQPGCPHAVCRRRPPSEVLQRLAGSC